jgi:hypothetical protein
MLQRRYTRAVAATQIAQNLAFVNWMVLTGLAFGSFGAVVLLRRRTTATPGYLRFTTICAVVFGVPVAVTLLCGVASLSVKSEWISRYEGVLPAPVESACARMITLFMSCPVQVGCRQPLSFCQTTKL